MMCTSEDYHKPLQAYYNSPRRAPQAESSRYRFQLFQILQNPKKLTKEYQLDISCECDSCVPHQLWELLHFFDSMDNLESIQEFGHMVINLISDIESNTIQN